MLKLPHILKMGGKMMTLLDLIFASLIPLAILCLMYVFILYYQGHKTRGG